MLKNVSDPQNLQSLLLALLSTSGTLAGLSLTLSGIVNLKISETKIGSIADDMFLFSSIGFLFVCYCTFFTLQRLHSKNVRHWTKIIDLVFLCSLTLLVLSGFVVVYSCL